MNWNTVRFDPAYEEKIDPEILPLCDALNAAGFVTTASCCGHGRSWPYVCFEPSSDERIEAMARFVMAQHQGDYRPFLPVFQKEILTGGYEWCLEIHLNNVYANTAASAAVEEALFAISQVAASIQAWSPAPVIRSTFLATQGG